ncbi:Arc-like DNA binding domain-containing protein [Fulvimarina manganoxydans]|uniref:Arc-like DNA binding domain-containing protein n=1 Tax=Fulvimarina manganoxydans TaxID=937218 RepID=A0A1W2BBZ5_9HYPH|nr:Arc family DNA-binding protein [Fulvimarina manganoxydans]SMC70553.1 Arc-like DNA binding domain-containing protein [Fulvimarina manganoxydans]
MAKKAAEYDQFQVRLPPGMRDQIKAASEANNRSMNAEVVARLEESLSGKNLQVIEALATAYGTTYSRLEYNRQIVELVTEALTKATQNPDEVMQELAHAIVRIQPKTTSEELRDEAMQHFYKAMKKAENTDE